MRDDLRNFINLDLKSYPFHTLFNPKGGIVNSVVEFVSNEIGVPDFYRYVCQLGNISQCYSHLVDSFGNSIQGPLSPTGSGASESLDEAFICALVEALERYASMVYLNAEIEIASASELSGNCLDVSRIPRCSQKELADPKCNTIVLDENEPIRWVKGYSIVKDQCEYVPLVMSHLLTELWPSERFWIPISTGIAAHTDYYTAVVSAICEVIERDALAITWLAQLPLPRVKLDKEPPQHCLRRFNNLKNSQLTQYFFDATSEFNIPSIYSVQLCEGHPTLSQFVSCATDFSAYSACSKTIREAGNARIMFQNPMKIPDRVEDFHALEHGAAYMGLAKHREAFNFLLESEGETKISSMGIGLPTTPKAKLKYLIDQFKSKGMDIAIVDLTTDDLRENGLWVIRAIIPDLMPMPYVQRARFLGHPRLYQYAEKMGVRLTEADINPYPQPFA